MATIKHWKSGETIPRTALYIIVDSERDYETWGLKEGDIFPPLPDDDDMSYILDDAAHYENPEGYPENLGPSFSATDSASDANMEHYWAINSDATVPYVWRSSLCKGACAGFKPRTPIVEKLKEMKVGDHVALIEPRTHDASSEYVRIGTIKCVKKLLGASVDSYLTTPDWQTDMEKALSGKGLPTVFVPKFLSEALVKTHLPELFSGTCDVIGPRTYDPKTCKPEWVKTVFSP